MSRSFVILGFCIFLPWVLASVSGGTKDSPATSPVITTHNATETPHYPTAANGTTETSPNATTHYTTMASTASNTTVTDYTTIAPNVTMTHVATNATSHLTTEGTTNLMTTHDNMTTVTLNETTVFSTGNPTTTGQEVTSKLSTVSSTAYTGSSVVVSTTPSGGKSGSHFDAASFLGGIVLMLGLSVIAVVGYRCYKKQRSSAPPYRVVDE